MYSPLKNIKNKKLTSIRKTSRLSLEIRFYIFNLKGTSNINTEGFKFQDTRETT